MDGPAKLTFPGPSIFPDEQANNHHSMLSKYRGRAFSALFLLSLSVTAPAVENQFYRNGGTNAGAENGHNNGADLANVGKYQNGWSTSDNGSGLFPAQSQAFNTVLAPSDVVFQDNYNSDYWSAQRSTMLGELVALRLEVVEFRRLVILALGILFGFETMKYLFRWV